VIFFFFKRYQKIMTKFQKKVPANLVPAAAVIREGQALFGMIGRKEHVDGFFILHLKFQSFTLRRSVKE
jgi:hypothetical protein